MKTCRDCRKDLPLSEFYPMRGYKLGVGSYCRACHKTRTVARRRDLLSGESRQAMLAARRLTRHPLTDEQKSAARARHTKWRMLNGHKVEMSWRTRQAQLAAGHVSLKEWGAQLEYFGKRCAYCGIYMKVCTRDHVQPISRGGANTIDNVIPACKSCNSRKGSRGILSMVNVQYGGT